MTAILLDSESRQHRLNCRVHIADKTKVEPASSPKMLGPPIDLDDASLLRIELPVWKIRAQHQQCIAVQHSVIAGRESNQSCHADIIGIVVFHMFFAAEGVHNWR